MADKNILGSLEIKLKENSNLIIKNHSGETLCSVDEATGKVVGAGLENVIGEMIEADKDIISKIEVIYHSDGDYTEFIFPKGVMPLSIELNTHELYFLIDKKAARVVGGNGNLVEGYDLDDYYVEEGKAYLELVGDLTEQVIGGLVYLSFNGNSLYIRNTYELFFPQKATKLYKHEISFSYNAVQVGTLMNGEATPIYIISTRKEPYDISSNLYLAVGADGVVNISNENNALFGLMSFDGTNIDLDTDLVNGTITYEQVNNFIDYVDEL